MTGVDSALEKSTINFKKCIQSYYELESRRYLGYTRRNRKLASKKLHGLRHFKSRIIIVFSVALGSAQTHAYE